jgi:hypothetical protein
VDPATIRPLPVTINLGGDLGRADTGDVHYVRDQLRAAEREIRYGLPVINPVRTALEGARWAADRVEAVVFLDQITRALGVRVDELEAAAAASRTGRDTAGQTGVASRRAGQRHAQGRSCDRRRDRWSLVEPDWWRRRRVK